MCTEIIKQFTVSDNSKISSRIVAHVTYNVYSSGCFRLLQRFPVQKQTEVEVLKSPWETSQLLRTPGYSPSRELLKPRSTNSVPSESTAKQVRLNLSKYFTEYSISVQILPVNVTWHLSIPAGASTSRSHTPYPARTSQRPVQWSEVHT